MPPIRKGGVGPLNPYEIFVSITCNTSTMLSHATGDVWPLVVPMVRIYICTSYMRSWPLSERRRGEPRPLEYAVESAEEAHCLAGASAVCVVSF